MNIGQCIIKADTDVCFKGGFMKSGSNTKEAIRSAFIELYKTQKPDHITVDMICRKSYISRSTFYKYYPNSDAVMAELEHEVEKDMVRIYQDYNYLNFLEIDSNLPSPNFIEMFRCILRNKDFFTGAYSDHGNPSYYARSKKNISENIRNTISGSISSGRNIDIICDLCSDYIILCCKMIIKYEDRLSPKGLAIEVKKQITDFVRNENLYIEGE